MGLEPDSRHPGPILQHFGDPGPLNSRDPGCVRRILEKDSVEEYAADAHAVVMTPDRPEPAADIGSDYECREALLALVRAPKFGAAGARAVLDAAAGIGSDYEQAEVLVELAGVMPPDAGLIERYREVARGLSDFERGKAERALDRFAG